MGKKTIALVGGTGHLGTLIANALLAKPDVQLRLLVRPGSTDKVANLIAHGAEVVEGAIGQGDEAALDRLANGATTIVSAIQGGPDLILGGRPNCCARLEKRLSSGSFLRTFRSTCSLSRQAIS